MHFIRGFCHKWVGDFTPAGIGAWVFALFLPLCVQAQTMSVEEYEPKSTLAVPQHPVTRARYPFIDVHNHQSARMSPGAVDTLVQEMDKLNLRDRKSVV